MKKLNSILSVFLIISIIINTVPISVFGTPGENEYPISIYLEDEYIESNTNINDKTYDGTCHATIDYSNIVLEGIAAGDDVYLKANAEFNSKDVEGSPHIVTIKDFYLEGIDSAKYELMGIPSDFQVERNASITPKEISVIPKIDSIYYGQRTPDGVKCTINKSEIFGDDTVNVTADIVLNNSSGKIGTYDYTLANIVCDNKNYKAVLQQGAKFQIKEYNLNKELIVENENDIYFNKNAKLTAPDGFSISADGVKFSSHINVKLDETNKGERKEISYYLRNTDKESTEYNAISKELKYEYTCSSEKPEITSAIIKSKSSGLSSILKVLTFGIVSNDSVTLTITAKGTFIDQPTTIYLSADGGYQSEVLVEKPTETSEGVYYYSADFTIDMPESGFLKQKFSSYASNKSGDGTKSDITIKDAQGNSSDDANKNLLILDQIKPTMDNTKITYNNNQSYFEASGSIKDQNSGIQKIEYKWDSDLEYTEYGFNSSKKYKENGQEENFGYNHRPDGEIDFKVKVDYKDSADTDDNYHTLYIRITDNAGNVHEESGKYITKSSGYDQKSPEITYIDIQETGETSLDKILKFFTFGNYSNESLKLVVKAKDESESSFKSKIATISLYDGQVEYFDTNSLIQESITGKRDEFGNDDETYEYVFVIPETANIENMVIRVVDNGGQAYSNEVLKEIERHFDSEKFDELPNEYLQGMISNSFLVEDDAPIINFDVSQSSNGGNINTDGKIWYNSDGGELTMTINDETADGKYSGIYNIVIEDYDSKGNCISRVQEPFGENNIQKSDFGYLVDTSKLDDGQHKFVVTATDNAGNTNTSEKTIYVDKKPPEGVISVEEPKSKLIGENQWFDKDSVITFRINAVSENSGLESISLTINEKQFEFSREQIEKDANGYFVLIDTKDLNYDNEQRYRVSGTISNIAMNTSVISPLTVYVDCENPVISQFTVKMKNGILGKILNVLSFGAFSNDSLIFQVHVSDSDFDSGIDYVSVLYDGLTTPIVMKDEGAGVYSVEIPVGTKVFQSDIVVTAYDKFGKNNTSCPNIENAEQGKGVSNNIFAMIETIEPEVTINQPVSDGVARSDGQIWYNSNKTITVVVQDEDSGVRNVDVKVNNIDITTDKNNVNLVKMSETESADKRDNKKHIYTFDTDYLTSKVGEPADGKYIIKTEVTDNAGNVTVPKDVIYYIDKASPTVDKFEFLPATSDNISQASDYIEVLEYGLYFKTEFTAKIYVSDITPSSGLDKVVYRLVPYENGVKKTEETGEKTIKNGVVSLNIPAGFKGQIFVEAFDNTWNRSGEKTPEAFVVDDIVPQINITSDGEGDYRDSDNNKLYVSDVALTVTITDTKSGLKEIGYSQSADNDTFSREVIKINNNDCKIDDDLGDGWIISKMDANLVTEVTKTFNFSEDDNNIIMNFDATDRSGNKNEIVQSEKFTIDKTLPVINVEFSSGINDSLYYNAEHKAVITITIIERNFDANLINTIIENTYNGRIPTIDFEEVSESEHRAVITLFEGDYTFDVNGVDLGNHTATVNFPDDRPREFYVDETKPVVEDNFITFSNTATENSFNTENKTAVIKVTEHNFDASLMRLKILRKEAGTGRNSEELTDVTSEMLGGIEWNSDGDLHTISFEFVADAIYKIEISPSDLAENASESLSTAIFEIDKTIPIVTTKNGSSVIGNDNEFEFLDIYPYSRKDDPAPTVNFMDLNSDYIKYVLTVYVPEYTNGKELANVKPVRVYLDEDKNKSGKIKGNSFTLPDFIKDGVYALELIAVDKAGNESVLNLNTYMRMVDSDALAYISNSNSNEKTGWYSFQYENGDPISKRPDNFSDIDIVVLAKTDTNIDVVLRDYNGDEKNTNLEASVDDSMFGIGVYNYTLKADYFKDNYQDDTDIELYLSVKNEENRIDLGKMHIDNIMPSCDLPKEFESWHWYFGDDTRTITIDNISELLNVEDCKVYDNGKEIDFQYSSEDGTFSFALEEGWHYVGVTLADVAGNANNIQEKDNIYIGFFWLWIIILSSFIFIGVTIFIVYNVRKKYRLKF